MFGPWFPDLLEQRGAEFPEPGNLAVAAAWGQRVRAIDDDLPAECRVPGMVSARGPAWQAP